MNDADFLEQFERCTLPFDEWTHRAHVKVGFLYLRERPIEAALKKTRSGILAYNKVNHVPDGPKQGYNETTTHAMLRLIQAGISAYGSEFPTPDADSFCDTHPQLMHKHVLRLFYSPERRMRPDAKTQFVEPDLAPLPRE